MPATCRLLLPLIMLCIATAHGAEYPSKPIRLLVGYSPGGPNDTQARLVGQRLSASLGQPVIVDNRAGADGIIAADMVAKASADGYTLILVSAGHAISHNFHRAMPFDPLKDFQPIAMISTSPFVLVAHPSLKASSVPELIALAKSQPGKLIYGSAGAGSSLHLAAALFHVMTGTSMVHVPYKGGAPATTDLIAGQLQMIFNNVLSSLPHVRSGRLRALGVSSNTRSAHFPDTPAIAETVPGYEVTAWYGILGPAKLSRELVARLNVEIGKILAIPDVRDKLHASGLDVAGGSPERLGTHMRTEFAKWVRVVKETGIRTD
jgi:tripartite-type tricarboxylate transporter receptor subunit TctC